MLKISFSRALCLKRHRTQSSHSSSQPTSHPVTFGIQMISHHLAIASRLLLLAVQKALMEHQSAYERSFANYCNLCIAARCSKFCQPVELIEKFIKQNSIFLEFGEIIFDAIEQRNTQPGGDSCKDSCRKKYYLFLTFLVS